MSPFLVALLLVLIHTLCIIASPQFPSFPQYSSQFLLPTLPLPPSYSVNITQRIRNDGREKWRFDVFVDGASKSAENEPIPKLSIHLIHLTNQSLPQTGTFALLQPPQAPLASSLCYIVPMDFGIVTLDLLKDFQDVGVSYEGPDGKEDVWRIAMGLGEVRTTNAQADVVPTRASIMSEIQMQWDQFKQGEVDEKYFEYDYSRCDPMGAADVEGLKVTDLVDLLVEVPLYVLRMM
uniref:Uncharacterized protein n=1 Tax=Percolomonas cosmopolitus TaxID=63605 RepID=A0A7S1KN47_9EUKA|eukprot:CAMPEP_0117445540 /NCGR_PEP_ID=MMETSP0759-20121206/5851_1 /TAXON_ID=63605 /ORGANISM="Percolomonas cosmopolitus, Strain WS" /LENGTH=234 /DNA_ID=CAMNT_0005237725 /DNA_START=9 /DNA_END=713 /DNA_ORIENTATION=+